MTPPPPPPPAWPSWIGSWEQTSELTLEIPKATRRPQSPKGCVGWSEESTFPSVAPWGAGGGRGHPSSVHYCSSQPKASDRWHVPVPRT